MCRRERFLFQYVTVFVVVTLALAAINQNRKEIQIELHDQEIYTREPSGQLRQLTKDGKPKEHVVVSPSGERLIYHATFDPYKLPPEPVTFSILDIKTGKKIKEVLVKWAARFVSSVEWINKQFVMVRGESGFLAILNLETGRQTHNLFGSDFSLSPDGTKIVYRHDFNPRYGAIPPEYESDYVLLSLVERDPTIGQKAGEVESANFKVIYPELQAWGEVKRKAYYDPDKQHHIQSSFSWSPDSRDLALIEANRRRFQLVVLEIETVNGDVAISRKRFDLGPAVGKILGISWISGNHQVKASSDKANWVIDLKAGTVQSQ